MNKHILHKDDASDLTDYMGKLETLIKTLSKAEKEQIIAEDFANLVFFER
jgi:hypothetical protein